VEKIRRGIALTDDDRQPWLERVRARQGHFAGEQILASQLADLEEPDRAVIVDIAKQHHNKSWLRFGRSSAWRRIFAPQNRSTKRPGTYPCRRIPTHVRLMPFLFLLYIVAYLDRINMSFAGGKLRSSHKYGTI
jgi:hypothetical protein